MSIKISKSDIVWNYLGNIMTLGVNLFLLPFILRYLQSDELGLWYTFAAVGNIAGIFDFGFKATMGRNITYAWCGASEIQSFDTKEISKGLNPNFQLMSKIMQVTKIIYLIIALVALVVLGSCGTLYIYKVSIGIPFSDVVIAWGVYIIGVFFNLYYGYYSAFLSGVGAIKQINTATVVARSVQLILAYALLTQGYGLISMSVAYCVFCVVFRMFASFSFSRYEEIGRKIKEVRTKLHKWEFSNIFRIVWYNAWRDGLVAFTSFLNGQATTLLCSWFLSLEDTAIYGLSMQLVNAIASIGSIYFSTYQSKMQELYIERDIDNLKKRLSSALFVYRGVYLIGSVCVCTFGIPLLAIIKSNTRINISLLVVLYIYMFFYKNHTLFASYLAGTNRIIYVKAYVISSVAMIFTTLVLLSVSSLGIWALAISPLFVESLYNNWYWPRFVLNELGLSYLEILRQGAHQLKEDILR